MPIGGAEEEERRASYKQEAHTWCTTEVGAPLARPLPSPPLRWRAAR